MNYYKVLSSENKTECTQCGKRLSGVVKSNIIRHYKLIHRKDIDIAKKHKNKANNIDINAFTIIPKTSENMSMMMNNDEDDKNKVENFNVDAITTSRKPKSSAIMMSHYKYYKNENVMECNECGKKLKGANKNNVYRHYRLVHNKEIKYMKRKKQKNKNDHEEEDDDPLSIIANTTLSMTNYYYKYLMEENLIECCECGQKVSATHRHNIFRHYELVHNKFITLEKLSRTKNESEIGEEVIDQNYLSPPDKSENVVELTRHTDLAPPKKSKNSNIKINMDKNAFLTCCVGLVTVQNIPLDIFDCEYFKTLISPHEKIFETNLSSSIIANVLEFSTSRIQETLKNRLKNRMLSLKIDIATGMGGSILAINIQYINDFKTCLNTIGLVHLNKSHTAAYLKDEIFKCLQLYEIEPKQIYSCTADNGANAIQFEKILEELQLEQNWEDDDLSSENDTIYDIIHNNLRSVLSVENCATHALQLAVHDVIKDLETQIEDCRKFIETIRGLVRDGDLDIEMPILGNTKQWTSIYEMLKSLQCLEDTLDIQNDVDWKFVLDFLMSFAPLANFAKQLQQEKYILGDFYRDWLNCEIELEDISSSTALLLYQAMQSRKDLFLQNDNFVAALYLDPRFNFISSPLMSEEQKTQALTHLVNTFNVIRNLQNSMDHAIKTEDSSKSLKSIPDENEDQPNTSESSYAKLAQRIRKSTANSNSSREIQRTLKEKLIILPKTNMVPLDADILEYWKTIPLDADILNVMKVVLAVPVSQVSIQHAFSALALKLTKSRNVFDKSTFNNLLLTKLNFSEINDVKFDFSDQPDI